MQTDNLQASGGIKEESQLVTFLLKDEEFGFDIMSVQEIIRLPQMAKVPRTPSYVDGIANLRGVVLPVIDVRTRFGMERAPETDRTRVLVVDIDGVKTGLRVDRVNQVTRVQKSDIEAPPAAIHGTTGDFLQGLIKLDKGQRIVMALNAAQVCRIDVPGRPDAADAGAGSQSESHRGTQASEAEITDLDVVKLVTFSIAKEEFAFPMKHVREILRVTTPNQIPDVPEYVLGILTVRGEILPVIDLRRLLQQQSMAEEFAASCRPLRDEYALWIENSRKAFEHGEQAKAEGQAPEQLRKWVTETNSSSQVLMEEISKARWLNEKVIKQLEAGKRHSEHGDESGMRACRQEALSSAAETVEALRRFESLIAKNIQEDQRIVVVDVGGVLLGLVVDHVNEVMNVSKRLIEPPPRVGSHGGIELSGVAKLQHGSRLVMLLNVENLMHDEKLQKVRDFSDKATETEHKVETRGAGDRGDRLGEIQLVTFMLGAEEYGIPISQIQEIDRLSNITKVPKAAHFIEGITNLRGEVIPVLDTRKRFDLEVRAPNDRTRIIIVDLGGVKTGLVVDSVREVLNLSRKDIAAPPAAIQSAVDQQFISGIGKVNAGKRMVVLLDVERILTQQERTELSEIAS